jgi:hypothetical protein
MRMNIAAYLVCLSIAICTTLAIFFFGMRLEYIAEQTFHVVKPITNEHEFLYFVMTGPQFFFTLGSAIAGGIFVAKLLGVWEYIK